MLLAHQGVLCSRVTLPLCPAQDALRPVLLRRMKEDVENLPDKEEVVVWVELTPEQRHYYRAIFAKEVGP